MNRYVLAAILAVVLPLILACAAISLGAELIGKGLGDVIVGMFGGISDGRLNNVEAFPGTVTWQLDESGPWNIRVAYDGEKPPTLGALRCTLKNAETQKPVELVPCDDEFPAFHTGLFQRSRHSAEILLFTIDAPGAYVFEARYPDGAAEPKLELAASRGHSGEPLGRFWTRRKKSDALLAAAAASFLAGVTLGVVTWLRRRKKAVPERDTPPEPPGPTPPVG